MIASSCPCCRELQEHIEFLREELGYLHAAETIARLRRALRIGRRPAVMIDVLFKAKGRTVTRDHLLYAIGSDNALSNLVSVYVCHVRRGLGADSIETVAHDGYRLTKAGIERVRNITTTELV